MIPLRRLTNQGIELFRSYLTRLASGSTDTLPEDLLINPEFSEQIPGAPMIDQDKIFTTRYDAAEYLHQLLATTKLENKYYDAGLMNWLAALYFDQICPPEPDGTRKPKSEYRNILNTSEWDRIFRHLIAGPVVIYDYHHENSRLLLSNPLDKTGDFVIQLMGHQEIARNKVIIEVANILYWDPDKNRPKTGASATKEKPGGLRRYTAILGQLGLTHDFYSMTPKNLLNLLPDEFSYWKMPPTMRVISTSK